MVDRILARAGGPVDAVADFVGGQLHTTLAVLREGGSHTSIADHTVAERGGSYVWVRPDGAETTRLVELARAGKLTVEVAEVFPLERVADAFRASMTGHTRGKLIIVPSVGATVSRLSCRLALVAGGASPAKQAKHPR
ncbi:hypothetical protein FQR65_LT19989 [Abscondita terminalis]|nr:hypothetical protein FQR65_LT19989 [Abscondita terminalis]